MYRANIGKTGPELQMLMRDVLTTTTTRQLIFKIIVYYGFCSITMTVGNKFLVTKFHTPLTLSFVQVFIALLVLLYPNLRKNITYDSWYDIWRWTRSMSTTFLILLISSMFAMKHISLGTQILLRNLAPLFTAPLEKLFGEKTTNGYDAIIAMISIIPGTILYANEDIHFNHWGAFWISINLLTNSFQKLLQRQLVSSENSVQMSKMCMVFVNNLFSLVCLLPLVYYYEYNKIVNKKFGNIDIWYYGLLFVVSLVGICIGYVGIWAQENMSASSMLILVNSNKFIAIILGMIFLGDPHSLKAIIGCSLSILATIWYGYVKAVPSELSNTQLLLNLVMLFMLCCFCIMM